MSATVVLLLAVLVITALAPLFFKKIGENLEVFLFAMGFAASLVSGALTARNLTGIFSNYLLYVITAAVLVVSFLFKIFENRVGALNGFLLSRVPLKVLVFLLIVLLGLFSSVITAVIASLLLTEFVSLLPLSRQDKVRIAILGCFSIGLGAVLTPVGEPLSTIVTSRLGGGFFCLFGMLGAYILPGVLILGVIGALCAKDRRRGTDLIYIPERETAVKIVLRAAKIFIFVVGLDMLGNGFKPVIDAYVIHWSNALLYLANLLSAILDNATLTAAEISPAMSNLQIKSALLSLLVSGGMLVTGNIPNIVTAGKLKISMKEWAKFAVPVGGVLFLGYYAALFAF